MIKLIAAASENGIIGVNNKLPWNCSEDLRFFKEKTLNGTIIMGRKTYESIGRPLPKRTNIVITSGLIESATNLVSFTSLQEACFAYPEAFIIGGSQIYREALVKKIPNCIYLNKIHTTVETQPGDEIVTFPWIDNLSYINISIAMDESKAFTTYSYLRST